MGAIYGADATMEIVASALFILKLVLNASIIPSKPLLTVLRRYAAVIFALVINLGLGIGNVVTCKSSQPAVHAGVGH